MEVDIFILCDLLKYGDGIGLMGRFCVLFIFLLVIWLGEILLLNIWVRRDVNWVMKYV